MSTFTESLLDTPKETLDTSIWNIDANPPTLTIEAENKIADIVQWVTSRHNIPNLSVFIIGSITSNQYTENSDIDIDFCSDFMNGKSEDEIKDFGWSMKSDFIDNYPEEQTLAGHPLEIFFQPNQFQCMMSIGCYNVLEKKWEVGPELAKLDYDPLSEIYKQSQKQTDKIIDDIRNMVLAPYETASIFKKSNDAKFKQEIEKKIKSNLNDAGKLYKTIKKARSAFKKDPISKEDALKKRSDKKWQTTDAAFKLLDKFGYVSVLKEYLSLSDEIEENKNVDFENIADAIINVIQSNFKTNKMLIDNDMFDENDETCNESFSDLVKMSVFAGLLAIPGILPAADIDNAMKSLPKNDVRMTSDAFQDKLAKINDMRLGKFSMTNAINILSWTLYGEAGNQDVIGKKAVGSVILNMGGAVPEKMLDVVITPNKFSMWKSDDKFAIKHNLSLPSSDASYTYKVPKEIAKNVSSKKSWDDAVKIATQMALGKFKSTIGNRNAYLNVEMTKREFPNSTALRKPDGWYYKMTDKLKIKDHTFGYLPENDGYKLNKIPKGDPNATEYTVKKDDSLWKIAYMFNTSSKNLARINGISVKTPLKIGQVIKLKSNKSPTNAQSQVKPNSPAAQIKQKINIIDNIPTEYIVKKGDNLWNIAKMFNLNIKDIIRLNGINVKTPLQIGQKLKLKPAQNIAAKTINYGVKKGDTLWKIAKKFNVTVDYIAKLNGISPMSTLNIGQTLKI